MTSCKSMTSLLLKSISMEQRPRTAHGSWCVQYSYHIYIYIHTCVLCVCLIQPFRSLLQRLSQGESLPTVPAHLFEFHWLGARGNDRVTSKCVFTSVCPTSGKLCVAPQTHKVNAHVALQPSLLLLCLSTGICYLAPLFPLSPSPNS